MSNSMVELYTIMRYLQYLQYDTIQKMGNWKSLSGRLDGKAEIISDDYSATQWFPISSVWG